MYFAIGGRRTQSGLYRVTLRRRANRRAAGTSERLSALPRRHVSCADSSKRCTASRIPPQSKLAWPHLNSNDRAIRYAARVAIEHQDPKLWPDKALAETRTTAAIQAPGGPGPHRRQVAAAANRGEAQLPCRWSG